MNSRRKLSAVSSSLYCGTAVAALAMFYPLAASAQAQATAAPETVEVTGTIIRGAVPTGSNVITVDRRAIESTGAVTIQNILSDVPGLNNFGGAGQGGVNSSDPAGAQSPTIHSLGNSASNGTLVLVDGHRLPYTGNGHSTIDPSSVPVIALQQVQVLADGASSTYGSDAVAGVLNFITRKDFTGMEFDAQYGIADHYSSVNAGALFGHAWDGGSALVALDYSSKSELANGIRSYETPRQDLRLGATTASWVSPLPAAPGTGCYGTGPAGVATIAGTCIATTTPAATTGAIAPNGVTVPAPSLGSNFDNFNCPVATIKASSSATVSYLYPYATSSGVVNNVTSFNGMCSTASIGTDLPSETRNTIFASFKQNITNDLSASLDFDYSFREDGSHSAFGSLSSIAAFGPTSGKGTPLTFNTNGTVATSSPTGGQINPFYVGNSVTGTSTENISFDPTPLLLANGFKLPLSKTFDETAYGTFGLAYAVGGDWELVLGSTFGTDYSGQRQSGNFCTGCAELALNGTTNNTGTPNTTVGTTAIVDPNGLSTVTAQSRSLTTLNALDVWDPVGSNQTSAAVLKQIASAYSLATGEQSIQDVTLKADGTAFDLPAGPVKIAVGGEYTHNTMVAEFANASNTVAAAPLAATFNAVFGRTVWAGYAEILAPIVSPEMNIPLVQKFDVDISGRIDDYTFYGDTENPKIGFTWGIFDGLTGRGSFGTSFTVPAFNSGGINGTGITSQSGASSTNTVPVSTGSVANTVLFNDPRYNAGAGTAGTFLSTAAGCVAAGSLAVNAAGTTVAATDPTAVACKVNSSGATPGLSIGGGGGDPGGGIKPEVGRSYSAGFDFDIGKMFGVLEGLTGEVTYYQATYKGLITNINITTSNLGLTHFAPPGGWASTNPAVIAALGNEPLTSTIPQTVYFYTLAGQNNAYNLWTNGLDYGAHYSFDTDYGAFRAGLSGNQLLRFSQQNLVGALFTDLNGDAGNAGRFAAQQMTVRATLDWSMDSYRAGLGFNFQSAFKSAVSAFPYSLATNPNGAGFQHIHPLETIDLNLGYTIPDSWYKGLGGAQVTLTVTNLLDTNPPFIDSASGFASGSELGRVVTIALKQNF